MPQLLLGAVSVLLLVFGVLTTHWASPQAVAQGQAAVSSEKIIDELTYARIVIEERNGSEQRLQCD